MDKVLVLLSTYNGSSYLRTQLDSLLEQKGVIVQIFARDDGSTDGTQKILDEYSKRGNLIWYQGNNVGPAKSFMELLIKAPSSEFYAFSDQDDYRINDKLKIGVDFIKKKDYLNKPVLYYGRPRLANAKLEYIKNSRFSKHKMMTFSSSIINSNATGCTMIFNEKLKNIVISHNPVYFFMHDDWIHKVCLVFNGDLIFDDDVHIKYRQHGDNVIGISNSFFKRLKKHINSLYKKPCVRSKVIISLYNTYGNVMNKEQKELVELIAKYKKSIKSKSVILFTRKIRCDYFVRNLYFKLAILLNSF